MPFVDKSTLTYPATNAFPVRKWLDQNRAPTSGDYKNFQIFDLWIWEGQSAWIMIDKTATSGLWVNMATTGTGILTITGDSGGSVGPDGANNIFLLGGVGMSVAGNAGINTLTINAAATVPLTFATSAGNAQAAANVINFIGAAGISTSGAASTVTITAAATVPLVFHTDGADATPAANAITIAGAGGITTSGAGATVTVTAGATIATQYTTDAGVATPAANNLNIIGSGSTTTSAVGDTITINSTGGGLMWTVIAVAGPTAMAVNNGYVANTTSPTICGFDLPAVSAVGSILRVAGYGTGGWVINQIAGQQIRGLGTNTTLGATGTLSSSESDATVEIVCVIANTIWKVLSSTGNLIFT